MAPPLLAGNSVEMTPWERTALQNTGALSKPGHTHTHGSGAGRELTQGLLSLLTEKMKRNHEFSSSDSELDENIEVEKESADENGYELLACFCG